MFVFYSWATYTICSRLSSQVYNINTKAADFRSETGGLDKNTSTRKISPLNYFVLGKNSPAYRTNTHLQTYEAISTCPRIFWNGFLTKCFESQILSNFESPMITTVPAWRPSPLYRSDYQGGGGDTSLRTQ